MVPEVGLEPTSLPTTDSNSVTFANFVIRARISVYEEVGTLLPLTTRQAG